MLLSCNFIANHWPPPPLTAYTSHLFIVGLPYMNWRVLWQSLPREGVCEGADFPPKQPVWYWNTEGRGGCSGCEQLTSLPNASLSYTPPHPPARPLSPLCRSFSFSPSVVGCTSMALEGKKKKLCTIENCDCWCEVVKFKGPPLWKPTPCLSLGPTFFEILLGDFTGMLGLGWVCWRLELVFRA